MKSRYTVFIFLLLSVLACASCRAVLGKPGTASLSFSVQGAVGSPRKSARVIIPSLTSSVRARILEEDGTEHAVTADFVAGPMVLSMEALPTNVPLDIRVESLASDGTVLTSWRSVQSLAPGPNRISATLSPATALNATDGSTLPASGPVAALARNGLRFDSFSHLAPSTEIQLIYDTGKAEYARLRAFDSSWNPLEPVASDESEGWAVVTVPADGIVNSLCSNDSSSADYPARDVSGFTQARRAYFASPAASGAGTSASPGAFDSNISARNGQSLFLRQGTYSLASPLLITDMDIQIYGGFDSGSWAVRDVTDLQSTIAYVSGSNAPYLIDVEGTTRGRLDGCYVNGSDVVGAVGASAIAVGLGSSGPFIVKGCSVSGTLGSSTHGSAIETAALHVVGGSPEIAGTQLHGGNITGNISGATTYALRVSGSGSHPYLHGCRLNAGSITGAGTGSTYGVEIENSANLTMSGCRVWGGTAHASGGSTVNATGLAHAGSGSALVANSVISGGSASSVTGSSNSRGLEIGSTSAATVAGCVIDGGYSTSSTRTDFAVHLNMGTTADTPSSIVGCLILCSCSYSTSSTDFVAGFYQEMGLPPRSIDRLSGNAYFACQSAGLAGPPLNRSVDDLYANTRANNAGDSSRAASSEFVAYPTAANTLLTYSAFTSLDLRPSTGATYAGSPSHEGPSTWNIATAAISQYPALAFDLSGKTRPTAWARGAYER